MIYRKSSIKPPKGGGGGGLNIDGGGICGRGLLYLETTMLSVLYKELEYNVEKLRYKKFQVKQPRIRIKAKLNHPGSVHTKFYGRD